MYYASATTTRRNLAAFRRHGFGVMFAPSSRLSPTKWDGRYAIDNGAWTAFQKGTEFDGEAFRRLAWRHGIGADFVVAPDVVMGGVESLDLSLEWLPWLLAGGLRVLVPVQNGMSVELVRRRVRPDSQVGIFVGGDTEWKESSLPEWAALARETGCHLHVGRVNSARRVKLAKMSGVDSCDGSGPSRFAVHADVIGRACSHEALRLFA